MRTITYLLLALLIHGCESNEYHAYGLKDSAVKLESQQIIQQFSNKTVKGQQLAKNRFFKRYYGKDNALINENTDGKTNKGRWQVENAKLCHYWGGGKISCNVIKKDNGVIKLYNQKEDAPVIKFSEFNPGNSFDKTALNDEVEIYDGPIIDGHGHLGGDFDVAYMNERNQDDGVIKMVVFPRMHYANHSGIVAPPTSEKYASEVARKYPNMWVTVGLQRNDLYEMDWHSPNLWFYDWLKWATQEIESGRRRGLGELTARHYAYTKGKHAERDFPINSKLVDELLKSSAQTQRPLVIHAEAEEHVVNAIKAQLQKHPKAILVWSHACGRINPKLADKLLSKYDNLYCDLGQMTDTGRYGSLWPRHGEWTYRWEKEGKILPEWIITMEKHPDKFFLGMDSNSWPSWESQGVISRKSRINRFRAVLPQLSDQAIKSVTTEVAEKLFGDR